MTEEVELKDCMLYLRSYEKRKATIICDIEDNIKSFQKVYSKKDIYNNYKIILSLTEKYISVNDIEINIVGEKLEMQFGYFFNNIEAIKKVYNMMNANMDCSEINWFLPDSFYDEFVTFAVYLIQKKIDELSKERMKLEKWIREKKAHPVRYKIKKTGKWMGETLLFALGVMGVTWSESIASDEEEEEL